MNLIQIQFQELSKNASIKICSEDSHLLGTGFFVLPNQILTCYHVINNQENIRLFSKNGILINLEGNENIKSIHTVPDNDIVIIELQEKIVIPNQFCLKLSSKVQMGDSCYSVGFSKELFSADTVLTKYVDKVGDNKQWLKLRDDRIVNGFSGSGLVNSKNGHVVGVISESLSTSLNLGGLAIPNEVILKVFPYLKNAQEHFFEKHLEYANIYKRLLFDYKTIEGVDIIDDLFIEYHRHQGKINFTPREFYLATPYAQWWGIINNLTIDKKVFPIILDLVEENFSHPSPIISILHGSGGMGKSTTARKLLYHFKNQYECIWIDDLLEDDDGEHFFNEFLPRLSNGLKKILIVLDDWGKLSNTLKGKFKKHFKKYHKRGIWNIKFIITARKQHVNDILLEWQVPNSKVYFNVAEELRIDNKLLLDKFLNLFNIKQENLLSTKTHLIGLKPFHLLFTLIRAKENEALQEELNKKGRYGNYFQDIINFDINELYKDEHKRGFVYALIFSAYLSSQHNYGISKSTFLQIADKYNNAPFSLVKNKQKTPAHSWDVLRFYISEYISEKNKRGNATEQIQFNKDDFKEAILKADLHHSFQSALDFFNEWKKEAIEEILHHGSIYSSSVIGFVFGGIEKTIDKERIVETLLKKQNSHHTYTKLFLDKRFILDFDKSWNRIKYFLTFNDDNHYTFSLVSNLINRTYKKDAEVRNNRFSYLLGNGVNHPNAINGYLNSLTKPETAIKEAKRLIQKSDSFEVICNCLKILEADPETAIKEAKRFIQKSDDHQVICNCLKILEAEPEGQTFALSTIRDWTNRDRNVIIRSLNCVSHYKEAQQLVSKLIYREIKDYYLYIQIIKHCHDKFPLIQKLTAEILGRWKGHSLQIVGICLNHYEHDLALTKPVCEGIIAQWYSILFRIKKIKRANFQFFLKSMAHPNIKDLIRQKSNEMLTYESSNSGFLPKKIKQRCLLIIENNEFQEWIYEEDSASNIKG